MRFKAVIAVFLSNLILAGAALASQELCPELKDIQAEGFSMVNSMAGIYFVMHVSSFNTDATWAFVVAPLEADSDNDALEKANNILSTMNTPGVVGYEWGTLICTYDTGVPNVLAVAAKDIFLTPMKFRQYMQKTFY